MLFFLSVSVSGAEIMEVGRSLPCPAEGGMFNCRELTVDFDALLAADEFVIGGSAALVGLIFGRDIALRRDNVFEGHMYTFTVSGLHPAGRKYRKYSTRTSFFRFQFLRLVLVLKILFINIPWLFPCFGLLGPRKLQVGWAGFVFS